MDKPSKHHANHHQPAGIIARRRDGNRAIYSIKLPLVFQLCELVCNAAAEQAQQRAALLRG